MWFIFALLASAFWGLTYVLNEQIFKQISIPTALAIEALILAAVGLLSAVIGGTLKPDLVTISHGGRLAWYLAAGIGASISAGILISLAVSERNATLAGLVEVSYPIFIALFAYVLFKEGELGWPVALGGALILSGVFVIYWFAR